MKKIYNYGYHNFEEFIRQKKAKSGRAINVYKNNGCSNNYFAIIL